MISSALLFIHKNGNIYMQVDLSVLKTPLTIDIKNDESWVDYIGKDIRNEIVMKLYKKNFYFNASKKDSSNLKIFIISGEKEEIIKEIKNLISLKEII